jgi:hypothetical protein
MNENRENVEVSYKVVSDSMGIWTVAFFVDDKLLHIIAGEAGIMLQKLNQLFDTE